MKKFVVLLTAAVLSLSFAANAEAKKRQSSYMAHPDCNITMPCEGVKPSPRGVEIARQLKWGSPQQRYVPQVAKHESKARRVREVSNFGAPSPIRQSIERVVTTMLPHPAGCPSRAFCGCGTAVDVFGMPKRELWLAANWLKFPRATPAPGMVAARRGHVFVLKRETANGWLVADYNSGGGRSRLHVRSLRGYTVVNPHGGRYASL